MIKEEEIKKVKKYIEDCIKYKDWDTKGKAFYLAMNAGTLIRYIEQQEKSLYKQVKNLFEVSREATELYNRLNYCTQLREGDILYVFESKKEAEESFWKTISSERGISYNTERLRIDFYDYKEYYKTIDECKRELDGYRFKKIIFM